MKKLFIVIFLLFLCVIGGIVAKLSYSFNPEVYKEKFIKNVEKITGRKVEIKGPVSFTWTPLPTIQISDLSVTNHEGSKEPVMFSTQELQAEIEWKSLFRGPFVIRRIILKHPKLLLERVKANQTNFSFPVLFNKRNLLEDVSFFMDSENDFSLKIENLKIEEGEFTYSNLLSGDFFIASEIRGEGKIDSLDGPFAFSGSFSVNNTRENVNLSIGKIEVSQPLSIVFNLDEESTKTEIKMEGSILQDQPSEWMNLAGLMVSQKPAEFLKNYGISNWPEESMNSSFSLNLMVNQTILRKLTARLGEGEKASFFVWDMDEKNKLKLFFKDINYFQWKPFFSEFLKTKFFNNLTMDVYFLSEKMKFKDEFIDKIELDGSINKQIFSIKDSKIQLPYDTILSLVGNWNFLKKEGEVETQFQSSDLRALLKMFLGEEKISVFPKTGMKNIQLTGTFSYQDKKIFADVKTGLLDESEFSGNLALIDKKDIQTSLNVKNVNVNSYFDSAISILKKDWIKNHNIQIDLTAENLTVDSQLFKQFILSAQTKENTLLIKKLSGTESDDVYFNSEFSLDNLGSDSISFRGLKADFKVQTSKVLEKLGINSDSFDDIKDLPLNGTLSYDGDLEKGQFDTHVILQKADISAKGELEDLSSKIKFSDLDFSLSYPDVQGFFVLFKKINFFPKLTGDFSCFLKGAGTLDYFSAKEAKLKIGKQILEGDLSWKVESKEIKSHLTSPNLDLDLFLPNLKGFYTLDKISFEIPQLPSWDIILGVKANKVTLEKRKFSDLLSDIALKNQTLAFSNTEIKTENKKGKILANGKIIFNSPLIFEANISMERFPVQNLWHSDTYSLVGGDLSEKGEFSSSGNSWYALFQNLQGSGNFEWKNGIVQGLNFSELASIVNKKISNFSGNSISSQIKHTLSNGESKLALNGLFQVNQGNVTFSKVKGDSSFVNVTFPKLLYSFLSKKVSLVLSIFLKITTEFPSIELEVENDRFTTKTEAFEEALKQEVDLRSRKKQENVEKEREEEAKNQKNEILNSVRKILEKTSQEMKKLRDEIALKPSPETQRLLEQAEALSQELQELAVVPDLNGEQLLILQEKEKLLFLKFQELSQLTDRQNILKQRDAVQKLPALVKTRIFEINQIYKQNPESSILSSLLRGSEKEQESIDLNLEKLSKESNLYEVQNLIQQIKESFQKIQKALDYARQFDTVTGIRPTISGFITQEGVK